MQGHRTLERNLLRNFSAGVDYLVVGRFKLPIMMAEADFWQMLFKIQYRSSFSLSDRYLG